MTSQSRAFPSRVGWEGRQDSVKQCCLHENGFRPIVELEQTNRLMREQLVDVTAKAAANGRHSRLLFAHWSVVASSVELLLVCPYSRSYLPHLRQSELSF